MSALQKNLAQYLNDKIWNVDLAGKTRWQRGLLILARVTLILSHEILHGQLTLRAMSLVFTTLLSLVPLLAVSFSILKGFGVHNQIEPVLLEFLSPLGENGRELSQKIIEFVENIKVGVLGSMGLALLIYTVISLIQKVEEAFNYIWHVLQPRNFSQRFTEYLSVIIVGPLLIFSAMGLFGSLMSTTLIQKILSLQPFGELMLALSRVLPYVFLIIAFTFIYMFIPNVKVKFLSALMGGTVAAIFWHGSGYLFALFVGLTTQYSAVYSGFAILILFMIWLYISWLIVLAGAKISYFHQFPEFIKKTLIVVPLNGESKERLAYSVLALIASHYSGNQKPWTLEKLREKIPISPEHIQEIISIFLDHHILIQANNHEGTYYLAKDMAHIYLQDIRDMVRRTPEQSIPLKIHAGADKLFALQEQQLSSVLTHKSLKDLL